MMKIKNFLILVIRIVMSILLAGVFYTGWMAIAISTIKTGFGGLVFKVILWILAPIVTGFGFALGTNIFELFVFKAEKSSLWKTYKWCLIGCTIGGGIFCMFGPMLIVFGMFAVGTLMVILQAAAIVGKNS